MNKKYSLKLNTDLVSFQCLSGMDFNRMNENEEMPRSIRFPKKLWNAIDSDAQRCKRSSVKQLEALLLTYYDIENVEIDKKRLALLREAGNPIKRGAEVLPADTGEFRERKKRA